jgi:hypothetical protein
MKIARIIFASLIRLYARLLKQGFDIIPALGAGIGITVVGQAKPRLPRGSREGISPSPRLFNQKSKIDCRAGKT